MFIVTDFSNSAVYKVRITMALFGLPPLHQIQSHYCSKMYLLNTGSPCTILKHAITQNEKSGPVDFDLTRVVLTFCMLGNAVVFVFCLFFKINFFKKKTLSECQAVWIQIRTDVLSVLIWVQTV